MKIRLKTLMVSRLFSALEPEQSRRPPLKNAIGVGELALSRDIVDEAEFVAGLDQAAEGVLRALKATSLWQKAFRSTV